MAPNEIARNLKLIMQLQFEADSNSPLRVERVADAIVTIDPRSSDSPYPSFNKNSIRFMGCEQRVSVGHIDEAVSLLAREDVEKFFFWLSPGPQETEISEWLIKIGLTPFDGPHRPSYPVLFRETSALEPPVSEVVVSLVTDRLIGAVENEIEGVPFAESFLSTYGAPGFEHFVGFLEDIPISTGVLITNGKFGYLTWGGTAPEHREQGGQNALIVARINRAAELGIESLCSETLSILEHSLNNLLRHGFQEVYRNRIFASNV